MARLSFIEQERIARNMTDADILGEYEQEGSVLPPGIQIDKNVLLGEMEGRTYVRDATNAAQTAANMPPGTTADQQVEKFKGNMQETQQLLAMGPQGMPPQGMPPQGMPPQGMPPEMGPQMAADGGIIGLTNGGSFPGPDPDPRLFDPSTWRGEGLHTEIPYLSGLGWLLTGSKSIGEAYDNPLRTAGHVGLMAGTGGYGAMAKGARGLYGLRTGLPALLGNAGNRSLAMAQQPGLKGWLGKRLLGNRVTGTGASARASFNPGAPVLGPAGKNQFQMLTPYSPTQLGITALRRGSLAPAGLAALTMAPDGTSPDLDSEDAAAIMSLFDPRSDGGSGGGSGGGFGGALSQDLGDMYADRQENLLAMQEWLRTQTPEEKALDDFAKTQQSRTLGRIDRDSDKGDLLALLAGGAARAIDRQGRGGSAAETLADTAEQILDVGTQQRTRREGLEDMAAIFEQMPLSSAAERSRTNVTQLQDAALRDYMSQVASLTGIDLQTGRALLGYRDQIRAANEFGTSDLQHIENMAQMMRLYGYSDDQIQGMVQDWVQTIRQRLIIEAGGGQAGGQQRPITR